MSKFAYKATNKEGKSSFGVVEAESQALAVQDIRNLGLFPTNLREATRSDEKKALKVKYGDSISEFYFGGLKWKQIVVMTRQLATLIDAGLPLVQCLDILGSQCEGKVFKKVLTAVKADVENGSTVADALGKHRERLRVDAVRLRELAGRSGEVADLARIRHDHRHLHRRQRRDGRPFVPARFPDVD